MSDVSDRLGVLEDRLGAARRYLKIDDAEVQLQELEAEMAAPEFWSSPEQAQQVSRRYTQMREDVTLLEAIEHRLSDARVQAEFLEQGDLEFADELEENLSWVSARLASLDIRALLSGEFDEGDAIAEIHAGAGGTDSQDWAEMMLRMYERYAGEAGFSFELDEVTPGGEAGILSATFIVKGRYAYGLLQAERGVHRLVRMSPFDSQHRRHTSFASFEVTPLMDESFEVEIDDKELRIDTYRSSGAGGQHVNVTDSAVRITHLPTGIVVSCQNERSQLQNKARAMQILVSKLEQRHREEFRAQMSAIGGPQSEVSWSNQIRSYVLAPYQLVKDHRSGYEDHNVTEVLDGRIGPFIQAFLEWRRANDSD
ncbi:peptide chain release factor 2 [Ferrimicrobium sp.]|uniref:peptide chain release factor 2 n=1 Tax=Ferrimicrobium sp. TaxID=2926050 RepID=UPI00344E7C20